MKVPKKADKSLERGSPTLIMHVEQQIILVYNPVTNQAHSGLSNHYLLTTSRNRFALDQCIRLTKGRTLKLRRLVKALLTIHTKQTQYTGVLHDTLRRQAARSKRIRAVTVAILLSCFVQRWARNTYIRPTNTVRHDIFWGLLLALEPQQIWRSVLLFFNNKHDPQLAQQHYGYSGGTEGWLLRSRP